MATLNPALNFPGNCEEVFNFYKSVFGGEFTSKMRYKDMPGDHQPDELDSIMHVALPVGETVLMGGDRPKGMGAPIIGNNFTISIQTDTEAETDKLFNGLSAGGKITMPLNKAPWNAYFGMFSDKYGIDWMINCDLNKK